MGNGSCELFIFLKALFSGDTQRKTVAAGYALAWHPWASFTCPAVFPEPPLSLVLRLGCELCLEAAFGSDATAAASCSDIPPPDNESNKTLTGSCIGENSILQLLIKSKHPYFQQQEVGLSDTGQRKSFSAQSLQLLP